MIKLHIIWIDNHATIEDFKTDREAQEFLRKYDYRIRKVIRV